MRKPNSILLCCLIAYWLVASVLCWFYPIMSPDSWTLFDLSRWIWSGDTITAIRQYRVATTATISHPFLWPAMIGLVDQITHLGWRSGFAANMLLVPILPWALCYSLKPIAPNPRVARYVAILGSSSLLCNWYFAEDVFAGRTLLLSAIILAISLGLYFRRGLDKADQGILYGLSLGLGFFTRFDQLTFCLIMGVGGVLTSPTWRHRGAMAILIGAGFIIGTAPYLLYSYQCCHVFLATETRGLALSVQPLHPASYSSLQPVASLWSDPARWFVKILTSSVTMIFSIVMALFVSPLILLSTMLALPLNLKTDARWKRLITPTLALVSILAGPVLLSFASPRYAAVPMTFILSLWIATGYRSGRLEGSQRLFFLRAASSMLVLGLMFCTYGYIRRPAIMADLGAARTCARSIAPHWMLVLGQSGPEIAARTQLQTLIEPDNWPYLSLSDRQKFMQDYQVQTIFDPVHGTCTLVSSFSTARRLPP